MTYMTLLPQNTRCLIGMILTFETFVFKNRSSLELGKANRDARLMSKFH